MRSKTLAGALLVAALTFGAPDEARAGCMTMTLDCLALAWAQESYWDRLWAVDACQQLYMQCIQIKLLGV